MQQLMEQFLQMESTSFRGGNPEYPHSMWNMRRNREKYYVVDVQAKSTH